MCQADMRPQERFVKVWNDSNLGNRLKPLF